MHWRTAAGRLDLHQPQFLGILNITPDSFSDGGLHLAPRNALARAEGLLKAGAALLDLGAESTRPGARPVAPEEEWQRLDPVLKLLARTFPQVPLSLDTRHPTVAARGLEQGVAVLNDVTGFSDPALLELAGKSSCGLIAMRSRLRDGRLLMPEYGGEAVSSLETALEELGALKTRLLAAGISEDRILLDPGFGFGTVYTEDLALWDGLALLPGRLDWPVQRFCLGISRKRFLARRAGTPTLPPPQRDSLTHRAHAEAIALGYRIFRTHTINGT